MKHLRLCECCGNPGGACPYCQRLHHPAVAEGCEGCRPPSRQDPDQHAAQLEREAHEALDEQERQAELQAAQDELPPGHVLPEDLPPPAPSRPVRRFALSAAQARLLVRAAQAHPSSTRGRGRHVRTVEVLVSLGLARGTSADFHATPAGLEEARAHGWTPAPVARSSVDGSVLELPPERPPVTPRDPQAERFGDRDGGL